MSWAVQGITVAHKCRTQKPRQETSSVVTGYSISKSTSSQSPTNPRVHFAVTHADGLGAQEYYNTDLFGQWWEAWLVNGYAFAPSFRQYWCLHVSSWVGGWGGIRSNALYSHANYTAITCCQGCLYSISWILFEARVFLLLCTVHLKDQIRGIDHEPTIRNCF